MLFYKGTLQRNIIEKLQLGESNEDGLCGWIDEIFEDKIRICFF